MKPQSLLVWLSLLSIACFVVACQMANPVSPVATDVPVQTIRPFASRVSTPTFTLTPAATASTLSRSATPSSSPSQTQSFVVRTIEAQNRTMQASQPAATFTLGISQELDQISRRFFVIYRGPIQIRITDLQGRRFGYREGAQEPFNEMPFAYSLSPSNDAIVITAPLAGEYQIELFGQEEGDYRINGSVTDQLFSGEMTSFFDEGVAHKGFTKTITVPIPQRVIQVPLLPDTPLPIVIDAKIPVAFTFDQSEMGFVTVTPEPSKTPPRMVDITSSFEWDFGDGSPTSQQWKPVHTYQTPGEYTVYRRITKADGSSQIYKITTQVK
jgi:hypothetical protein